MTDSAMDNLLVGGFPMVTESATILAGEGKLVRGTLIAMLTSGANAGKCVAFTDADSTTPVGEGVFYGVLLNDLDATSAAAKANLALCGKFNKAALLVHDTNATVTVAGTKAAMRALNCYQIDPDPIGAGM